MSPDGNSSHDKRKLRALCLHGFRTSGEIMRKQLAKWGNAIEDIVEMSFLDAPFPAKGKSEVEGFFPPPYYEWFQYNKEFTEYVGLEESFDYITNYMKEHGPFDGFIGFSQGAVMLCALAGLQEKGLALHGLPRVCFVIAISGCKFQAESMQVAYLNSIKCPSLHFLGEKDWLKAHHEALIDAFYEPIVIRHPQAHTVPRLNEESTTTLKSFLTCNSFKNHEEDVLHSLELEHEVQWKHSLEEEDKMHELVDVQA